MISLNNQEEQRQRNYGPVPAGSMVLCRLSLEKPAYAAENDPYVSKTKSGLLGLWAKIEVISGEYTGVYWFENIWLPRDMQQIRLNEGQEKACNMWGARLRAMVEAYKGIHPKDDTPKAQRARDLSSWLDLNSIEFPVRVGINKEPYTKGDKTYWNNTIATVITPDKKEYHALMDGGEFITDGSVMGAGFVPSRQPSNAIPDDDRWGPVNSHDADIPF